MFKIFIITLLAIHCNCQRIVEIGDSLGSQAVRLTTSPHISLTGINSIPTLRTIGGISTIGVHPYGASIVSPTTYGLGLSSLTGLHSVGGLRLGHLGSGLSHLAVRPAAVNFLSAIQPAVHQVAVAQPAISTVVAQPAAIGIRPAIQTLSVAGQQPIVSAAVNQIGRSVEYKPIPYNDELVAPQVVEVEPSDLPIHIHFKSRSSTVQLSQEHIPGAPGTIEQTQSQDEPSKVVHEVVKPVIQEVREVIQPYRQVSQEVHPVVENVHTTVAKGEGERRQYVAQQYIPQTVQTVGAAVQPVAQFQTVAQPVAQFQTVAQPVAQIQTVAQPVAQIQAVAQPFGILNAHRSIVQPAVSTIGAVAQPFGILNAHRSIVQPAVSTIGAVAQPVVGIAQTHRSIIQPSVLAVQPQPIATVLGSGALLNSGVLRHDIARQVGLEGVPVLSARSQPFGSISFSRTYAETDN